MCGPDDQTARGREEHHGASVLPHEPVLVGEVLAFCVVHPDAVVVDGTVGYAGHAAALVARLGAAGVFLGIDRDPAALRYSREHLAGARCRLVWQCGSYRDLPRFLEDHGLGPASVILLDLGVSSPQLTGGGPVSGSASGSASGRGFAFSRDEPLDMRMNPEEPVTAADLVNQLDEAALAQILWEYGDERHARRIARALVREREGQPIRRTVELAAIIRRAIPATRGPQRIDPATRTFQALRIATNQELEHLARFLDLVPQCLAPGGRVAVISYHSGEDRLVKQAFRRWSGQCTCPPGLPVCACGAQAVLRCVTRKPVTPTPEETARNPRSRSARLRVAERLAA